MEDKKVPDKAILLMVLIPNKTFCHCGREIDLKKEDFRQFFIVTAADCPACGEPVAVSPGQATEGAGNNTIH